MSSQKEPEHNDTEQVEKEKKSNKWKTILGISFIILGLMLILWTVKLSEDAGCHSVSIPTAVLIIFSSILIIVGSVLIINPNRSERGGVVAIAFTLTILVMLPIYKFENTHLPCYPPVGNTIEPVS